MKSETSNLSLSTEPKRGIKFTLIELLIVISIIVVLVAMLLPALKKAKVTATKVVCQGNLKQTGMLMNMYQDDNRSLFPVAYQPNSLGQNDNYSTGWYHLLYSNTRPSDSVTYLSVTPNSNWKLLRCPGDNKAWRINADYDKPSFARLSYVGNNCVMASWDKANSIWSPIYTNSEHFKSYGGILGNLNLTRKTPSRISLVLERPADGQRCGPITINYSYTYWLYPTSSSYIWPGAHNDPLGPHITVCNILMCDGHVESVNPYKCPQFNKKYFSCGSDSIMAW
ncbi:MAG: hypothetical protein BWY31_00922 [Lentisphaerae bacterium ADurb.Bin242]|nr:MAG: hypothetical protein BWY31_00922 [Lentisphaerae bacterium ADurb.Bin242]